MTIIQNKFPIKKGIEGDITVNGKLGNQKVLTNVYKEVHR